MIAKPLMVVRTDFRVLFGPIPADHPDDNRDSLSLLRSSSSRDM